MNPAAPHERLLARRCSAYYRLRCEDNTGSKDIVIYRTADNKVYARFLPTVAQPPLNSWFCRPPRRIAELVPLEETSPLASSVAHHVREGRTKRKRVSQSGSNHSGNHRVRGNAAGGSGHSKKYRTIEGRGAAYNEACARILKGFEGRVRAITTGSSLSGLATHGREQSGDVTILARPSWPPDHEGSSPLSSPYSSYPSISGPPPPSPDKSQYLGYPSMGYVDTHTWTYYPPFPGQALGQDSVPQHPHQPHSYQQRVLVDPTLPSMGGSTLCPSPHSQLQQLPYSSQSLSSNIHSHPLRPPHIQSIIPTSNNGGDDYPRWPNPSSRVRSPPDSGLLNPCDLFVEVWCPLTTYNAITDIFMLEI